MLVFSMHADTIVGEPFERIAHLRPPAFKCVKVFLTSG